MNAFVSKQRQEQAAYFNRFDSDRLMSNATYRTKPEHFELNLNPTYAEVLVEHFASPDSPIQWHPHRNSGLSSQVCCLNFLAPLMHRPAILAQVLTCALGTAPVTMLAVGHDTNGNEIFVDFEWIGRSRYLSEWSGTGIRGAKVTSADALARFVNHDGQIVTVLIEWKYTESYRGRLQEKGNRTRTARYATRTFAPNGPIRADLGLTLHDFYWEPFYQMLRQQILAWQMERARDLGSNKVVVLHLSPAQNTKLRLVSSEFSLRFGSDTFKAFQDVLVDPTAFLACSIEQAFMPTLTSVAQEDPFDVWASYLLDRYGFLISADDTIENTKVNCGIN